MKGWIALALLVAALLLGGYFALSYYAYNYGLNVNLKAATVLGGALLVALALLLVLRRKRSR